MCLIVDPPGLALEGLGGGGDVVGAIALLEAFPRLRRSLRAIASFGGCDPRDPRLAGGAVKGTSLVDAALVEGGPRWFEDKLARLGLLGALGLRGDLPVYVVCTKAPFEDVMRGLRLLAVEHGVKSLLSVDIGGDGLLTGYESRLGSYRTDTLARAALASAVDRLGLKSGYSSCRPGSRGLGSPRSERAGSHAHPPQGPRRPPGSPSSPGG